MTTAGNTDGSGISQFNFSIQEYADVMNALTGVLQQHMQVYTQINPQLMEFSAGMIGAMSARNVDPQVAQNIVGRLISGLAEPGGGVAGRALVYQSAGYQMGMDPFQIRLALERGDPETLMRVLGGIEASQGSVNSDRASDAISRIFSLSATQADLVHSLYTSGQMDAATDIVRENMPGVSAGLPALAAREATVIGGREGIPSQIGLLQLGATMDAVYTSIGPHVQVLLEGILAAQLLMIGGITWLADIIPGVNLTGVKEAVENAWGTIFGGDIPAGSPIVDPDASVVPRTSPLADTTPATVANPTSEGLKLRFTPKDTALISNALNSGEHNTTTSSPAYREQQAAHERSMQGGKGAGGLGATTKTMELQLALIYQAIKDQPSYYSKDSK